MISAAAVSSEREREHGGPEDVTDAAATGGQRAGPGRQRTGRAEHLVQAHHHHDGVQRQEDRDQRHRDPHGLAETEQEHPAQDQQQHDGHGDGVSAQDVRQVRVLHGVHRRVRRRQRDRDDPRGRDEAEQHQHEQLAPPEREQVLQHRDRPLAVRALVRHPAVHRQHPQQRQRDDQQRRQR
jgi:hypothetical protein